MNKTTILSEDDREQAREEYGKELDKEIALFVVLDDGDAPKRIAANANRIAGSENDPRHVVWAKNPEYISGLINDQTLSAGLDPVDTDLPDRAYTVGPSGTIRFVIRHNDPEPNNIKIFEAFIYAERDSD